MSRCKYTAYLVLPVMVYVNMAAFSKVYTKYTVSTYTAVYTCNNAISSYLNKYVNI